MANFDWHAFMRRWSRELLARLEDEVYAGLPPEVPADVWLGLQPAAEDEIEVAEARLGTALPPSYREFLKLSNGWPQLGYFGARLWPADEIDRLSAKDPELVNDWEESYGGVDVPDEEYLVYGEAQDTTALRVEYLSDALIIGDGSDGVALLLNPQVLTAEGEWEAWFLASWLPGARRYPSFLEMMRATLEAFIETYPKLREP